jgi:predicted PurR-regulated permease PerM
VLSAGFYVIGLYYWLLVGAFVRLIEMVPIIGPLIGSILILAVVGVLFGGLALSSQSQ